MSDKNTYARRSQRHKQEPDICENTNQLNEAVKSKTGNENKQPKIPKKKSNYISTKIDTINDGENKCLVYSPVYESTVPFKNANQLVDELAQK